VKDTPIDNLKIIPAGRRIKSPAHLFEGDIMTEIFEKIKFYYDIVIVDSAPVIPVSDPMLISSVLDGVILVMLAGRTPRKVSLRAKNILLDANADLLGVGSVAGGGDESPDVLACLRVDDDPAPIDRLQALVDLHHLFFKPPTPGEMVAIEGDLAREIQRILQWAGTYDGPVTGEYDAGTRRALTALIGNENFEERCDEERGLISRQVVDIFRRKFAR